MIVPQKWEILITSTDYIRKGEVKIFFTHPTEKGAPELTLPSLCLLCGFYVSCYSTHLSGRAG